MTRGKRIYHQIIDLIDMSTLSKFKFRFEFTAKKLYRGRFYEQIYRPRKFLRHDD